MGDSCIALLDHRTVSGLCHLSQHDMLRDSRVVSPYPLCYSNNIAASDLTPRDPDKL